VTVHLRDQSPMRSKEIGRVSFFFCTNNYQGPCVVCLELNFNTRDNKKNKKIAKVSNDITSKVDRRKHLPVFSRSVEGNVDFLNSKTINVVVKG